jgi:peptidoglycan hydrolase-like protein with peptidoglycan-binding domain
MSRRTLGLFVLGAVVVSSLATWFASSLIHSPAEIAARTAPPDPSPILVPVEERVLATKVVTRGTGHYSSEHGLSITPSALKEGPRVITGLPNVGAKIAEGDVILTVSGRPVFLLRGRQPSYRDLGPGVAGEDVRQLESALARLGLDPGTVDGIYDGSTGQAVAALYREHGFEPIVATEAQLAAVRPIETEMVAGARASAGIQVPADELIFAPSTPLRVAERLVNTGAQPDGTLLRVRSSEVAVSSYLPLDEAGLVEPGAEVVIDEPDLGINAVGTVDRVAEQPGTDGADGFHVSFDVIVADPPPALIGASVRLTVPIESTGQAVLAVPLSAVSLGPDGSSRVQRSVGSAFEFVQVRTGLSADGYVSVTPKTGALEAGDLVVVGFEPGPNPSG